MYMIKNSLSRNPVPHGKNQFLTLSMRFFMQSVTVCWESSLVGTVQYSWKYTLYDRKYKKKLFESPDLGTQQLLFLGWVNLNLLNELQRNDHKDTLQRYYQRCFSVFCSIFLDNLSVYIFRVQKGYVCILNRSKKAGFIYQK